MLNGFWKLTGVEIKVFMCEPMGVIGALGVPVFIFLFVGRGLGDAQAPNATEALPFNVAIMAALFIAIGAALSLIAIITIYREGGILKRFRATPLLPLTILGAHVGFVISSIVPTARFAQPLGSVLLYPMVGVSGLFFPIDALPAGWRIFANMLPTTHAVALMQGIWDGAGWGAHWGNVGGLEVTPEVDPGITGLSTSFWFWRDVPRSVNIVPRTPLESAVPASYVV